MAIDTLNEFRAVQAYAQRPAVRMVDANDAAYDSVEEMAVVVGLYPIGGWPEVAAGTPSGHGNSSSIHYMG